MHIFSKNILIILQNGLTEEERQAKIKALQEQLFLLRGRSRDDRHRDRGRGRGRSRGRGRTTTYRYVVYQRNCTIHFN